MTLLTTLIDFRDTGILDIFIDENMVRLREMQMGKGGLMKGQDMASTFSFLRPNDLVWNYVVGNYLKGETPPPFDLLYWNSDSTNLPGPFYAWYLRNLYLENNLIKPGVLTVCGEKIDMGQLKMPVYIYGSREDHIVPVAAAYASSQVLGGERRFVMGASGHIAGVINPPAKNKRSHWLREDGEFRGRSTTGWPMPRSIRAAGGRTGAPGWAAMQASSWRLPGAMAVRAPMLPSKMPGSLRSVKSLSEA
jgi:polyhydroxyalkanoate synthase